VPWFLNVVPSFSLIMKCCAKFFNVCSVAQSCLIDVLNFFYVVPSFLIVVPNLVNCCSVLWRVF
jgi:hypothetical protein